MTTTDLSHPLIAYWIRFCNAFMAEVEKTSDARLTEVWHSLPARTGFHAENVLPRIASDLGLSLTTELFKVDAAMAMHASNGESVPIIFIECENDAATAAHEIRKLRALSCPLAVLITVIEWNPDVFGTKARRDHLLAEWGRIIQAHSEIWPRPGLIGIIVGEWGPDKHLRFYRLAFSCDGSICLPEAMVVDKVVSTNDPLAAL
jgi:hypothetical protein